MPTPIELRDPVTNLKSVLLDGVQATTLGSWLKVEGRDKFSVHVKISGTATVQVRVSNDDSPLDSDDGVKYGNDVTSSGLVEIKVPVSNIKAKVSSYGNGTVTATLLGV